jgi:hypothetical protein
MYMPLKDHLPRSWRATVSAWAIVLGLVLVPLAGFQALALMHSASQRGVDWPRVVIPRHDPACARTPASAAPVPDKCRTLNGPIEDL